jgi:hypothetical protein
LNKTNVPVGGLVLNRLEPNPFSDVELKSLEDFSEVDTLLGARLFRNIQRMGVQIERLRQEVKVPIIGLKDYKDANTNLFEALATELAAAESLG